MQRHVFFCTSLLSMTKGYLIVVLGSNHIQQQKWRVQNPNRFVGLHWMKVDYPQETNVRENPIRLYTYVVIFKGVAATLLNCRWFRSRLRTPDSMNMTGPCIHCLVNNGKRFLIRKCKSGHWHMACKGCFWWIQKSRYWPMDLERLKSEWHTNLDRRTPWRSGFSRQNFGDNQNQQMPSWYTDLQCVYTYL